MYKVAPLTGGFMITSILGFFISVFYIINLSETWGFTFALLFILMFISSIISMTKADAEAVLELEEKSNSSK